MLEGGQPHMHTKEFQWSVGFSCDKKAILWQKGDMERQGFWLGGWIEGVAPLRKAFLWIREMWPKEARRVMRGSDEGVRWCWSEWGQDTSRMLPILDQASRFSSIRMLVLFLAAVSIAKASLYSGAEEVILFVIKLFTTILPPHDRHHWAPA